MEIVEVVACGLWSLVCGRGLAKVGGYVSGFVEIVNAISLTTIWNSPSTRDSCHPIRRQFVCKCAQVLRT